MNKITKPGAHIGVAAPRIWMQTLGSGYVDLESPKPDQINWHAVSVSLARVPRWGAQTDQGVLSVAQHCEQGARAIIHDLANMDAAAAFLIHDAHEFIMGDIATPVALAIGAHAKKNYWDGATIVKQAIRSLKDALDSAIYGTAGIAWPLPSHISAIVKEYDERMFATERLARMGPSPFANWRHDRPVYPPLTTVDCYPWSENTVASLYESALHELLPVFGKCVDSSHIL